MSSKRRRKMWQYPTQCQILNTFMDQITSKIAAMTITQMTEVKNSNNMEKVGFIKGFRFEEQMMGQ